MKYSDFVGRVRTLDIKINQQLLEAERLKNLCEQITTIWLDDVRIQASAENKQEQRLIELVDCKRELDSLVDKRNEVVQELTDFFNNSLSFEDADTLILKYIHGKSIGAIADIKTLSYSGAASKIYRADLRARQRYEEKKGANDV